ncbi:hypothetical protein PUR32_10885, partial [Streptomyces sp. BE133]|nr:hypothetical protein [Streptomyces sp. BE133]
DVFVRGTDGALYQKSWNGAAWSRNWTKIGGPTGGVVKDAPAVVSSAPGPIDLVARGTDDALYHRTYSDGQWGKWENLGGTTSTAPSITATSKGLTVFTRGTDGALYEKSWNGAAWSRNWTKIDGPAAGTIGAPSAAYLGGGRLMLDVRGGDDHNYVRWITKP